MNSHTLPLPPPVPLLSGIVAPWVERCLGNHRALQSAVRQYGSPLNILNQEPFRQNIAGFDATLDESVERYRIFYARKPNKSSLFVRESLACQIGIDIASDDELNDALQSGCRPENTCVTSAIITESLARRVVDNRILTVVENFDQLDLLQVHARSKAIKHPILIRLGRFSGSNNTPPTRLGFNPQGATAVTRELCGGQYPHLELHGFHFHINGYAVQPRLEALSQALSFIDFARSQGLHPTIIDIGGGFPVNYLQSREEWTRFEAELHRALCGKRTPITWGNDGLGLQYLNGMVHGTLATYPYFTDRPKWLMLRELLHSPLPTGDTVASAINGRSLELRIEPGRALLDQCGVTVGSVVHRSDDSHGDLCVGLMMNFTQLRSSSADFLVDPILVSGSGTGNPTECYLSGSYCMDRDLIMKRKILLAKKPTPGDLICFLNTAGYMMHFLESPGHSFGLAANVVFDSSDEVFKFEERGRPRGGEHENY